jgi:catechol 2,3-dioxygenase-like lactoylglutathione lyase family enzyme
MLLRLDHVTLRSSDLARSQRFYCDLLGLQVGPRPAFVVPGRWFYLNKMPVLHLLLAEPHCSAPGPGVIDHFALQASGLSEFVARLTAAAQPFDLRHPIASSGWQMFITDPDGAVVELGFAASESIARHKVGQ